MSDKLSALQQTNYIEIYNISESAALNPQQLDEIRAEVLAITDGGTNSLDMVNTQKLFMRFPQIDLWGITSADIEAYKDQLDPKRPLERFIISECRRINGVASASIKIDGIDYAVDKNNLTKMINAKLADVGSKLRVSIGTTGGAGILAACGYLDKESIVQLGQRSVRLIVMGESITKRQDITEFGHNDHVNVIMVTPSTLKQFMDQVLKAKQVRRDAFVEQQGVLYRVIGDTLSPADLDMMSDLVLQHELGHIELIQKHGFEIQSMQFALFNLGESGLYDLSELNAELNAIASMVKLHQTDPLKAKRAFALWAMLRSSTADDPNTMAYIKCISNVMLASVKKNNADFEVDWARLQQSVDALKQMLDVNFKDIAINIRKDATNINSNATDWDYINSIYQNLLVDLKNELNKKSEYVAIKDPDLRFRYVAGVVVDFILKQGKAKSYQGDMLYYIKKIEVWMKKQLAIPQNALPYQLPPINYNGEFLP